MSTETPVAPSGAPIGFFPYRIPTYNNIQPFTYKAGMTYLDKLEDLTEWLVKYLTPYIDDTVSEYVDAFNEALTKFNEGAIAFQAWVLEQKGQFQSKIDEFQKLSDDATAAYNSMAAAAMAAITAKVGEAEAERVAAEAARDLAEHWAGVAGTAADGAVSDLFLNYTSATWAALGVRYAPVWTPEQFGAKRDGVTDDTPAIQQAIDAASAAGGGRVMLREGTYAIDGHKGDAASYDNAKRGGLRIPANITLEGAGKAKTILKNIANNFTMGIGIRGGANITLRGFRLDMGYPTKTAASLSFSSTRGEGIIYWNGTSSAIDHLIEDVTVMNTGHYGIGIQNVTVSRMRIKDCDFLNIGGDAIDIKEYVATADTPAYPKIGIVLDNLIADTIGLRATVAESEQDAAAFDLRGEVIATNLVVRNLNTYNEPDTGNPMVGAVGIRVNASIDSEGRVGGRKVRVIGGSVTSNKARSEGAEDVKRIVGVRLSESNSSVVGVVVDNCYVGFRVAKSASSVPIHNIIEGCQALNCLYGVNIAGDCNYGSYSIVTAGCDTGVSIPGNSLGNNLRFVGHDNKTNWEIPSTVYYRNNTSLQPPMTPRGYADDAEAAVDSVPIGTLYVQPGGAVRMRLS